MKYILALKDHAQIQYVLDRLHNRNVQQGRYLYDIKYSQIEHVLVDITFHERFLSSGERHPEYSFYLDRNNLTL